MSSFYTVQVFDDYEGPQNLPRVLKTLEDVVVFVASLKELGDYHVVAEYSLDTVSLVNRVVLSPRTKESSTKLEDFNGYAYTNSFGWLHVFKEDLFKWVEGRPETLTQGLELLK